MAEDLRVALIGYGLGGRGIPCTADRGDAGPAPRHRRHVESRAPRRKPPGHSRPRTSRSPRIGCGRTRVRTTWSSSPPPNRLHMSRSPGRQLPPVCRWLWTSRWPRSAQRSARPRCRSGSGEACRSRAYQNRRWDGEVLTAQKLIASGALGKVTRYEARLDRWRPSPIRPKRGAKPERRRMPAEFSMTSARTSSTRPRAVRPRHAALCGDSIFVARRRDGRRRCLHRPQTRAAACTHISGRPRPPRSRARACG